MCLKQQYVIPTGSREVCLLDWELKLSGYAIGRDMVVDEALKEWMYDGRNVRSHTGLMTYITECVEQEFQENQIIDSTPSGLRAFNEYTNTIDEMTDCCIEVTSKMLEHLEPYLNEIEDHLVAKGALRHRLEFRVVRMVGDDAIIEVTDEDESEQMDDQSHSSL